MDITVEEFYRIDFLKTTLRKTKSDAKNRRNLEFKIDLKYLLDLFEKQQGQCALSGWKLEFVSGGDFRGNKNPRACSIDRIDNNIGYIPGNVQLTCCLPNFLKSDMNITEFRQLCKDIASRA
jgi:hypothetical protein